MMSSSSSLRLLLPLTPLIPLVPVPLPLLLPLRSECSTPTSGTSRRPWESSPRSCRLRRGLSPPPPPVSSSSPPPPPSKRPSIEIEIFYESSKGLGDPPRPRRLLDAARLARSAGSPSPPTGPWTCGSTAGGDAGRKALQVFSTLVETAAGRPRDSGDDRKHLARSRPRFAVRRERVRRGEAREAGGEEDRQGEGGEPKVKEREREGKIFF